MVQGVTSGVSSNVVQAHSDWQGYMQSSCHSPSRLDKVLVLAGWVVRGLHHSLVVSYLSLKLEAWLAGGVEWAEQW